jgi:hypothetical protein
MPAWVEGEMVQTHTPEIQEEVSKGLGGWMVLVIIQLCLPPLLLGTIIVAFFPTLVARAPHHDPLKLLSGFLYSPSWLIASFAVYCLLRIIQKSRTVPKLMTIFYAVCLVDLLIYWIGYANGYVNPQRISPMLRIKMVYPLNMLAELALNLTWMAYFNCSVRVKNTFTR